MQFAQPKISKKQAATNQLETAIKLFLENRDLVSSYTLAAAAGGILEGIWENLSENIKTHREQRGRSDRGLFREEWRKRLNPDISLREGMGYLSKHQNFFKHADRDHDQELEFNEFEHTALKIFLTIQDYNLVYDQQTKAMTLFYSWYAYLHPAILGAGHPLLEVIQSTPKYGANSNEELAAEGYRLLKVNCPELFRKEL